jgi:thiol-disulfide isomerase/thioredoxin
MQTKRNRTTKTTQKRKVIGKLYATWCGHCQTLEPEWQKMKANLTKLYKGGVDFVEIESENMKHALDKLNKTFKTKVKLQGGYPTLFKIEPGKKKAEYYKGNRVATELTKWSMMGGKNKTIKAR